MGGEIPPDPLENIMAKQVKQKKLIIIHMLLKMMEHCGDGEEMNMENWDKIVEQIIHHQFK